MLALRLWELARRWFCTFLPVAPGGGGKLVALGGGGGTGGFAVVDDRFLEEALAAICLATCCFAFDCRICCTWAWREAVVRRALLLSSAVSSSSSISSLPSIFRMTESVPISLRV